MKFNIKNNTIKSFLLLLSLGFTWGTSFSIARFAMESGVTPLGYSFWQSFGPAVLIFLVVLVQDKKLPAVNKQHFVFYFTCGMLGIVAPNLTMYFSAIHIQSGILGLIVNTSPILTYFLSIVFSLEKYSSLRFTGVVLGVLGLSVLFVPKISDQFEIQWMIFALLTPICLASCTVFMVKFRPNKTSSLALSGGMLVAATFVITPVTLLSGNFHPITIPLSTPNFVILIEIVLSSLGYILFFELLRVAGPVFYSLVGCIVSLSGLFWGAFLFDEQLNNIEYISIVFILVAIYLVSKTTKFSNNQIQTIE